MSVNFSTITPMNPATISKAPAFSTAAAPESQQPAASSSLDGSQQKKKSHWFRNTVIAAIILAGGATVLRGKVGMFKDFNKAMPLEEGAKFLDKASHYGKKAVAVVGDFIMENANKAYDFVKKLFKGAAKAE